MRLQHLLLALWAGSVTARLSYSGHRVLRVEAPSQSQGARLAELERSGRWDFWSEVRPGRPVDILASPESEEELVAWLEEAGLAWEVMVQDVGVLMERELVVAGNSSRHPRHAMDWASYHSIEDIYGWFDYLEETCDFCQKETIGQTYEGRDMIVMKVCKGGCGSKPAMWIDAGIHAREWIAPATATWMLNELVEKDDDHEWMTKDLDWYFLPSHNPDGYVKSMGEDRLWRKTMSYYPDDNPAECYGVDANRNWDHHWGETLGYDHCSLDYRGPQPWSEVEVTTVRDWIFARKDSIKFYQTLHSYGQLVLMPWGYSDSPCPGYDRMFELAARANEALFDTHGTVYQVGCTTCVLYKASGISMDWMLAEAEIPYVYSIELRDEGFPYGFLLPPEEIVPTAQEVWAWHKVAAEQIAAEYR